MIDDRPSSRSAHAQHLAIVGGGPAATCLLRELARQARELLNAGVTVTVIERGPRFGVGQPYSDAECLPIHNLAGNESVSRIDKGRAIEREFHGYVSDLRGAGIGVRLRPNCEAVDMEKTAKGGYRTLVAGGSMIQSDAVVLALGHWSPPSEWPLCPRVVRPFPAHALQGRARSCRRIAILGSSLTAVDATFAVATARGCFERRGSGLAYVPSQGEAPARILLLSRGGYLPTVAGWGITEGKADEDGERYYDRYLHAAVLPRLIEQGRGVVRLADVWRALRLDLVASGAASRRLEETVAAALQTLACRMSDGRGIARFLHHFRCARRSIASRTYIRHQALLWQKAEVLRSCYPLYAGEDRALLDRFATTVLAFLQPVNFANAERLVALVRAGYLSLQALGDEYVIQPAPAEAPIRIDSGRAPGVSGLEADLLVDARGPAQDVSPTDHPLLGNLLRRRLVHPAVVPFVDPERARSAMGDPRLAHRVVTLMGRPHYSVGGLHVDPDTYEIANPDRSSARRARSDALYAVGPVARGFFPFSDGLHAIPTGAARAAADLLARWRTVSPRASALPTDVDGT